MRKSLLCLIFGAFFGLSFAMEDGAALLASAHYNQMVFESKKSAAGFLKKIEDGLDNHDVVCARAGCIACAESMVFNGAAYGGLCLPAKSLGCFLPYFLGTVGGALLAIPCVFGACWMHSVAESRMIPDWMREENN